MHDLGRSIAIFESPRCHPATLHQDPSDVEVRMPEWTGSHARAAVRPRRRPGPRLVTPGGRRAAALDRNFGGDDPVSDLR